MKAATIRSVRFLKESLVIPFFIVFQLISATINAQCLAGPGCDEFNSRPPAYFISPPFAGDVPKIDFKIHPNPNPKNFVLKFDVPVACDLVVRIQDSKGIEVYREELKQFKGFYLEKIDLTHLPEGNYFVNLDYLNRSQSKRMVTY